MTGRIVDNFWSHVKIGQPDECWNWLRGTGKNGYGKLNVNGAKVYAHRRAYELTHGPIPSGLFICHSCDNPVCCNPAHLWAGTPADNMRDRDAKGRGRHGGPPAGQYLPHFNYKLSEAQIHEIHALSRQDFSQTRIATMYRINPSIVSRILARKIYRWVAVNE